MSTGDGRFVFRVDDEEVSDACEAFCSTLLICFSIFTFDLTFDASFVDVDDDDDDDDGG